MSANKFNFILTDKTSGIGIWTVGDISAHKKDKKITPLPNKSKKQ